VGIALVRRLLAAGNQVVIYDVREPEAPELEGDVEFVRGDVRDAASLRLAARGIDRFFHLAALVPLTRAGRAFWEVNVRGTENAIDAACAVSAQHFVHLSSCAIYGVPRQLPVREDTPPSPLGKYAASKLAGERVALGARRRGLRVAVVRPRTVIGPGRLGILDLLFDWIRRGRPILLPGSGRALFQLVSNRDLAEAMVLASAAKADGEFNVGADRFATLREDLDEVARRVGSSSRVVGVPAGLARAGLQLLDWLRLSPLVDWHYKIIDKEFWFDNERPRNELGWRPIDSNVEMLCQAYEWYRGHFAGLGPGSRSTHRSPIPRGLLRLVSKAGR
jgi:nucleoside-diphosphate-sugar epimerase